MEVYGFVWHGAVCMAFKTESRDEIAAATIMHITVQKNALSCGDDQCEHTLIVTGELTPNMIRSGMTANNDSDTNPEE